MFDSLIKATKKCTKEKDIKPDKVLRPIGTVFKEWSDDPSSTSLPRWSWWRVKGYMRTFAGIIGDYLLYERCEEIEGIDPPANEKLKGESR